MSEVELPLNPPASATAADEPGLSSGLASILVIDDEAAIRESLEVLLSLEGYTTRVAGDGVEGLRILDQESFDLVPVSYTHLDVYKRQARACPRVSAHMRPCRESRSCLSRQTRAPATSSLSVAETPSGSM